MVSHLQIPPQKWKGELFYRGEKEVGVRVE